MNDDEPTFGHACPQHPDQRIRRVTSESAARGWLLTVEYACGHRHTRYATSAPARVRDTAANWHPVEAL